MGSNDINLSKQKLLEGRICYSRFVGSRICYDMSALSMSRGTKHSMADFPVSLSHLFLLYFHLECMVHVYECMHLCVSAIGK